MLCYEKSKLEKEFNNTLGDFMDFGKKYSLEKVKNGQDLFILDMNNDCKQFVVVFSCLHFLEHASLQANSGQPSFVCINATFNLVRGNFKLIVVGMHH